MSFLGVGYVTLTGVVTTGCCSKHCVSSSGSGHPRKTWETQVQILSHSANAPVAQWIRAHRYER